MRVIVVSLSEDNAVVASLGDVIYFRYKNGLMISIDDLDGISANEGSVIDIIYIGSVLPNDTHLTTVKRCVPAMPESDKKCNFSTVNREDCEMIESSAFSDLVITRVYSDCFFALSASMDAKHSIKIIGDLPDGLSISDKMNVIFSKLIMINSVI